MPIAIHHAMINCHSGRPSLTAYASALAGAIARTLRTWGARIRERHAFPLIDERDLREMGLSRWDIEQELRKPFWRE
jgi:uncharacterized protein YjiS (DUF1127 family)